MPNVRFAVSSRVALTSPSLGGALGGALASLSLGAALASPTAAAERASKPATETVWVFFADRPHAGATVSTDDTALTPRALARREARRSMPGLVDAHDLPVEPAYVAAVRSFGATPRVESRWLNAVSVEVPRAAVRSIAKLPFVRGVQPVRAATSIAPIVETAPNPEDGVAATDYGFTAPQLGQIDLLSLHARGFRGAGVVIGVLDSGFNRVHEAFHSAEHPLHVLAEYDFVNDDPNTGIEEGDDPNQHRHGTWILGTLAAYLPGQAVGAAYEASYVLAKTEDVPTETPIEEDFYVAGLEFIEAQGADLATSSLGYFDWYVASDFDGETAVTTTAVNIATANGLVCLTANGNGGHDEDPSTLALGAPADAFEVISCGASDETGAIAGFSSDGPSFDGRVKPEVLARGVAVVTVHSTNETGLAGVSGTSLSTPLVAGAVACILGARPDLTVSTLREALFATAADSVAGIAPDPLFVRGYGLVQADATATFGRVPADLSLDGTVGGADLGIILGAWGACGDCASCFADLNGDCQVDGQDLAIVLGAWK
ncbi:MAG: S8 family serine peptidase [Phycisphaerae bacterium]|nr:S8 family serine peptidase [Phycisphaerae bacterium]